jgi:uncharacterized membrane protein YhdT
MTVVIDMSPIPPEHTIWLSAIAFLVMYVMAAKISHETSTFAIMPKWLCIFCLWDLVRNKFAQLSS